VLLSSIGVLMGVAGVIAVKGLVSPLLYTARGVDVFVLAGVCATLLLVAFAASIIPAARINRRSPAEILRVEE
jgi:ABC-type antimicrobial peptide transport system permease subunit